MSMPRVATTRRSFFALLATVILVPAGCRAAPETERTQIESCNRYLALYETSLRRAGMPADQVTARLTTARDTLIHTADQSEASLMAMQTKCAEASKKIEKVIP